MKGADANTQDNHPVVTTCPPLEVGGVLLGELIATCTGRLMSVGLADIRGALHLGVDEGAWIKHNVQRLHDVYRTVSVYLGGLLGPRRVLLACAWIFTVVSFLIPFRHSFEVVIALLIIMNGGSSAFNMYFAPHSTGFTAMGRTAEVMGLQVRQQAYTLAFPDSFLLLATCATCCAACLVVVSFMSQVPTQYRQITAALAEVK
jgi:DHA2 family multidrug resistance protein